MFLSLPLSPLRSSPLSSPPLRIEIPYGHRHQCLTHRGELLVSSPSPRPSGLHPSDCRPSCPSAPGAAGWRREDTPQRTARQTKEKGDSEGPDRGRERLAAVAAAVAIISCVGIAGLQPTAHIIVPRTPNCILLLLSYRRSVGMRSIVRRRLGSTKITGTRYQVFFTSYRNTLT